MTDNLQLRPFFYHLHSFRIHHAELIQFDDLHSLGYTQQIWCDQKCAWASTFHDTEDFFSSSSVDDIDDMTQKERRVATFNSKLEYGCEKLRRYRDWRVRSVRPIGSVRSVRPVRPARPVRPVCRFCRAKRYFSDANNTPRFGDCCYIKERQYQYNKEKRIKHGWVFRMDFASTVEGCSLHNDSQRKKNRWRIHDLMRTLVVFFSFVFFGFENHVKILLFSISFDHSGTQNMTPSFVGFATRLNPIPKVVNHKRRFDIDQNLVLTFFPLNFSSLNKVRIELNWSSQKRPANNLTTVWWISCEMKSMALDSVMKKRNIRWYFTSGCANWEFNKTI